MDKVIELIKKLASEKFHGVLEIRFEAGNITFLKKVQTIKID